MDDVFRRRYGPWAVVAGGSQGLGAGFARALARRGVNLVLVAETDDPLSQLARTLERESDVAVRDVVVDLAEPDMLDRIVAATRGVSVGLLVCNAAHAPLGPFLTRSLEDKRKVVAVNCRAPVELIHHFGGLMADRGKGGVVLMSSMAGLQGTALAATYAASKAFTRVLGESLWEELRERGVDVLSVCPGPTRTPLYEATRPRRSRTVWVMEIEPVVEQALDALGRRPILVPGWPNRLSVALLGLLPRRLTVRVVSSTMRAIYPHMAE
jgi:short-subunit dehydrogenase